MPQKNTWNTDRHIKKRSGERMWTAGFRYSWRKMEMAAKDRNGWRQVLCGLCSTGSKNG